LMGKRDIPVLPDEITVDRGMSTSGRKTRHDKKASRYSN